MADVTTRIVIDADGFPAIKALDDVGQAAKDLEDDFDDAERAVDDLNSELNNIPASYRDVLQSSSDFSEAFQSGIGPLRGFTDLLGPSSQRAGELVQGFTDLGEAGQIMGARLGISRGALTKFASAMAILGVAVAAASAAYNRLTAARKKAEEFDTTRIDAYTEALKRGTAKNEAYADALETLGGIQLQIFDDTVPLTEALGDLGLTVDDVTDAVFGGADGLDDFKQKALDAGASSEEASVLTKALEREQRLVEKASNDAAAALTFYGDDAEAAALRSVTAAGKARDAWFDVGGAARDAGRAVGDAIAAQLSGQQTLRTTTNNINVNTTATPRQTDAILRRWGQVNGPR